MGFSDAVTLTLLHPQQPEPLQQWRFDNQNFIRIGRAPDNDVVLSDSRVSRYHLELRRMEISGSRSGSNLASTAWRLVNQGTNGTFLDGILVSQAWLANGSVLQLAHGGPMLKFHAQSVSPPKSPTASLCNHAGNSPHNLFCIHCGQPLRVERAIRQYQILRTLGQGGMGTTYLAWVPQVQAGPGGTPTEVQGLVVIKEMNADMAEISKAQELFEREARTLKALHHPGIPQFFDFFTERGKKYLVMELVHGEDLEKRIYKNGPVTPKQAIEWAIQTCDVLDYIHRQDPPLIHRDIKPANLLVKAVDNRIVVLDFGAVKEIGTPLGTRIGAEGYSAPEQDRGQPVTQSDLYAVGATLIFLLTGEAPHKFYRKQGKVYQFQLENVPTIAPKLRAAIEKVTKPNVRDRYQTAKELATALAACL
ncbi:MULTISPECIES: protein kinase domain-containing protein [Aerosakkonema]|uniref:protein kinase domain-containing protein n=1 Tax=Aerosakkonema TaxID=1246629 RepID=UPI0035B8A91F